MPGHSNTEENCYTLDAFKNYFDEMHVDWLQYVDWKMTKSCRRNARADDQLALSVDWRRFPKLLAERRSDQMSQPGIPLVSLDHVLNPNHDTDHVLSAVFSSAQGDQFCVCCAAER